MVINPLLIRQFNLKSTLTDMKINRKLIAYRAIIIIPFILFFPLMCIGQICEWLVELYTLFGYWLQSKIFNDE